MSKLSVELMKRKLVSEDEVKKATAAKLALSKNRKGGPVGKPSDPSSKMTKIKQIEVPKGGKSAGKGENSQTFGTATRADEIVGKMGRAKGTEGKKDGEIKSPKVAAMKKPNQTTKPKAVSTKMKNTESDGGSGKSMFSQAKMASEYVDNQPHGNKNMNTSDGSQKTVGKPSVKNDIKATTRPKGGERKAKFNTDNKITNKANVGKVSGFVSDPSDAPKKPAVAKAKATQNIVESGVVVKLGNKTKATFDIVSRDTLNRMVESYAKHGYELVCERTQNVAWKKDRKFLSLVRESLDAEYNFVKSRARDARLEAFRQFKTLSEKSYSSLYESRKTFVSTVKTAFDQIMEAARVKYLNSLNIYEGIARIEFEDNIGDIEMVTEATDEMMALRQFRNELLEEYGLDLTIKHIFVDGKKFKREDIKEWKSNIRK